MTHKSLFALLIALFPVFVTSCSDDDDDDLIGHWVRTSDFDGLARGEASSFSIGDKGYLVCGYDGSPERFMGIRYDNGCLDTKGRLSRNSPQ